MAVITAPGATVPVLVAAAVAGAPTLAATGGETPRAPAPATGTPAAAAAAAAAAASASAAA